jgi:hypothetical protein
MCSSGAPAPASHQVLKEADVLFPGGFSFANFITDVFAVFVFVLWFWLLIVVFSDLFRRRDISGFGKVLWVIVLFVLPYIGIFAYLLTQSRGMAERNEARALGARDELRRVVGFSYADELAKLEQLKKANTITDAEYTTLRARVMQ